MFDDQPLTQSSEAKLIAIVNMSFDFASMGRVFEADTKERFLTQVYDLLIKLFNVDSSNEFNTYHDKFCEWGIKNIRSSKKEKRPHASYGQIAKTLNVVLKVVVFYCNFPDTMQAKKIVPFLHPAIDTKMMEYLREEYRHDFLKNLSTIASVNKEAYLQLLKLVAIDIKNNFADPLYLVQWEDIIWARVNEKI